MMRFGRRQQRRPAARGADAGAAGDQQRSFGGRNQPGDFFQRRGRRCPGLGHGQRLYDGSARALLLHVLGQHDDDRARVSATAPP